MKTAATLFTFLAYGVATSNAAPIPKELKRNKDLELIVGRWQRESLTVDGVNNVNNGHETFQFSADGRCGTSLNADPLGCTYAIEAKVARIKWEGPSNVLLCVYELDGDTLQLGFVESGTEPPAKLAPAKGLTLYTLTRIKD